MQNKEYPKIYPKILNKSLKTVKCIFSFKDEKRYCCFVKPPKDKCIKHKYF